MTVAAEAAVGMALLRPAVAARWDGPGGGRGRGGRVRGSRCGGGSTRCLYHFLIIRSLGHGRSGELPKDENSFLLNLQTAYYTEK